MFEFIRHLYDNKNREVTFVVFDDVGPESSTSFNFKPKGLGMLVTGIVFIAVLITLLLMMFTPLSGVMYNSEDAELRERAIEIAGQLQMLQDSLRARDQQMAEIKHVLAVGSDTNFAVSNVNNYTVSDEILENEELESFSPVNNPGFLSQNEVIFSETFRNSPEFPTEYPVKGTFTRGYDPANEHYGVDIATDEGKPFRAIADGAIIDQSWTLNYGYVLHVQHSNGIVVVYKHAQNVNKSIGDIVLKGDILGTIGDVGLLSSGPHLHIEIWQNGIPQNPNTYLIKT